MVSVFLYLFQYQSRYLTLSLVNCWYHKNIVVYKNRAYIGTDAHDLLKAVSILHKKEILCDPYLQTWCQEAIPCDPWEQSPKKSE